jgi:hypothetical protein
MPEENNHFVRNIAIALGGLAVIAIGIYFYASREVGDGETPPPPPAAVDQPGINNFSVEGNVVRNNPGMESNIWYLVYDEPGAPGRNAKLTFTDASHCVIGDFDGVCTHSLVIVGARVEVTGFRDGEQVFVHTYRQVDLEEKG